jgi:hypothetical protein
MKSPLTTTLLALGLGLSIAFADPKVEQTITPKPSKWEYKVVGADEILEAAKKHGKAESFENGLNALGEDGWELVALDPSLPDSRWINDPTSAGNRVKFLRGPTYYFKRQKG